MKIHLSTSQWGGARQGKDGKIKTWRRAKDASQKQRWRNSRKKTVISKAKSARFNQP